MQISIDKLLKNVPANNGSVSLKKLMVDCDYPNMEMFRKDLIKYLKIKVKKFKVDDEKLIIYQYTTKSLDELFRYFGLRFTNENDKEIKHINVDTLYDCWDKKETSNRKEFDLELNKYIANVVGQENAFTFQGELSLKPYVEKTADNGVSLI